MCAKVASIIDTSNFCKRMKTSAKTKDYVCLRAHPLGALQEWCRQVPSLLNSWLLHTHTHPITATTLMVQLHPFSNNLCWSFSLLKYPGILTFSLTSPRTVWTHDWPLPPWLCTFRSPCSHTHTPINMQFVARWAYQLSSTGPQNPGPCSHLCGHTTP